MNFSTYFTEMTITQDDAKNLTTKSRIPRNDVLKNAIKNSNGKFVKGGILIPVIRRQHEDQIGENSVRSSIYYLPQKTISKSKNYYTGSGYYGGKSQVKGEIFISKPYVAKGATGGNVPINALKELKNKNIINDIKKDIMPILGFSVFNNPSDVESIEKIEEVLTKYKGTINLAYDIYYGSKKVGGNFLLHSIIENIVATNFRDKGYDSILGISTTKDKRPFISEIIDLREITYPENNLRGNIHHKFLEPS